MDGAVGGYTRRVPSTHTCIHTRTHTYKTSSFVHKRRTEQEGGAYTHARLLACLLVSLVGDDEEKADDGKGLAKREEEG